MPTGKGCYRASGDSMNGTRRGGKGSRANLASATSLHPMTRLLL